MDKKTDDVYSLNGRDDWPFSFFVYYNMKSQLWKQFQMQRRPMAPLAGVVLFPRGRVGQIKVSIKKPVAIVTSSEVPTESNVCFVCVLSKTNLPPANGVAVMRVVFLLLVELSSSQEETSFSGDPSQLSSSTSSGISFRRNRSPFKGKNDLNIYTV